MRRQGGGAHISSTKNGGNKQVFEIYQLTIEKSKTKVFEIYQFEHPYGLVISVGGQVPNNLAVGLYMTGKVRILGTSVHAIDNAENRFKFSKLCDALQVFLSLISILSFESDF